MDDAVRDYHPDQTHIFYPVNDLDLADKRDQPSSPLHLARMGRDEY